MSDKYVILLGFSHNQKNLPDRRLDIELKKNRIPFVYLDNKSDFDSFDVSKIKEIVGGYCRDNVDAWFHNIFNKNEYANIPHFKYSKHVGSYDGFVKKQSTALKKIFKTYDIFWTEKNVLEIDSSKSFSIRLP